MTDKIKELEAAAQEQRMNAVKAVEAIQKQMAELMLEIDSEDTLPDDYRLIHTETLLLNARIAVSFLNQARGRVIQAIIAERRGGKS